ncbi:MAG: coiled-coil domain-containing protein, partial [Actinomycetes bacterium]
RSLLLVLVVALVAPLLAAAPAAAGPQDRTELSQVQRKLDRVRRVLENARSDAADVAAALEQTDRDVAAAQAALAEAQRRFQAAQARRRQAVLEAARAELEVEAQQAVIDRRAYATYVNSGVSAMLTLVVDADSVGDLLDRSKLLDNVAKAANTELQSLVDAKVAADEARRRAVEAEREAAAERARMQERAAELEAVRAARAAAQEALERKIGALRARQGALAARSGRLIRRIKAEEAARRRAAERARRARQARLARQRAASSGPTVISNDTDGGHLGGPNTASYNYLTANGKRIYGLVERIFDVHSIGGWRPYESVPGSDHPWGRALDVMTWSNRSLGWRIAIWAVGNRGALGVKYVIFNGRIWTRSRGWHGYRHPSDPCNCNPTLRHDDHVHISVLY